MADDDTVSYIISLCKKNNQAVFLLTVWISNEFRISLFNFEVKSIDGAGTLGISWYILVVALAEKAAYDLFKFAKLYLLLIDRVEIEI